MIFDSLSNLTRYIPKYKREVQAFLDSVTHDMPDGSYEIAGKDVYAMVQSYTLKPAESVKVEAHNEYVDIQAVIAGYEGIDVFLRNQLTVETPYDSKKEVEYLNAGNRVASCSIPEQHFIMLFPSEAHRPQMKVGGTTKVRKFVIKMKAQLFGDF